MSAPVVTPSGDVVPLGAVAKVEERLGPTVIRRLERRRAITLIVSPPEDMPLEDAITLIRDDVVGKAQAEGKIPPGVRFSLTGAAGKLELAQGQFARVLLLALIICFLLIAALFEDFVAPIAVLVSVRWLRQVVHSFAFGEHFSWGTTTRSDDSLRVSNSDRCSWLTTLSWL